MGSSQFDIYLLNFIYQHTSRWIVWESGFTFGDMKGFGWARRELRVSYLCCISQIRVVKDKELKETYLIFFLANYSLNLKIRQGQMENRKPVSETIVLDGGLWR